MTKERRVADYMTRDVQVLSPDIEINAAATFLLDRRISGAPVQDQGGAVIGMLTKKDCFQAALTASYYQQWAGIVADYMAKPVEHLDAETDIVAAARRFLERPYRRFPVLENGKMVGIISRSDLLAALLSHW